MENRYKINYDLKNKTISNIKFTQGDNGTSVIEVNLLDGGLVKDVEGQTIKFNFLRADNNAVVQTSTTGVTILDSTKGKFECALQSGTLAVAGLVKCEMSFTKDGKTLSTESFTFMVSASIGVLSINYISAINSKLVEWQNEFNLMKAEYEASTHENTTVEIVNARNGEVNLNTRLTKDKTANTNALSAINDQLENMATQSPDDPYHASDFPRLTSETNDSLRLQRLFDKAILDKKKVKLEQFKIYNCNTSLILDMSYLDIDGSSATLDFTNCSDAFAIRLLASRSPSYYQSHIGRIQDFEMIGDKINQNIALLYGYDTEVVGLGVAHIDIDKINIHGFFTGEEYRSNSYIVKHYSVEIWSCTCCVVMKEFFTDFGENMFYDGCIFYNSDKCIYNENSNGCFNFTGCSFDYSDIFLHCQGGKMFLTNCHIEGRGTFIVGTANGALITICNSWVILLQTDISIIKPFQVIGTLKFIDCFFAGCSFGQTEECNSGTGLVTFTGSEGYATFDLAHARYGANSAKVNKNIEIASVWGTSISQDKHTAVNAIVTYDNTTFETGVNAIKFAKTYGGGSESSFEIDIPLTSKRFGYRIRMKATREIPDATLMFRNKWVSIIPNGETNIALDGTSKYLTNLITNEMVTGEYNRGITTEWSWITCPTSQLIKPTWVTHNRLSINAFNIDSNDIFIDRIEVYEF